jgi:hypothetical protein
MMLSCKQGDSSHHVLLCKPTARNLSIHLNVMTELGHSDRAFADEKQVLNVGPS